MAHIGEDIKLKRRQALLTQKELANKMEVHVNTVRKIESCQNNIQLDILIKACDVLKFELELKMNKVNQ